MNQSVRKPHSVPTARQVEVYEFCADFMERHQQFPSTERIADHFGWSSQNSAHEHLQALERKGFLKKGELAAQGRGRNWMFTTAAISVGREALHKHKGIHSVPAAVAS